MSMIELEHIYKQKNITMLLKQIKHREDYSLFCYNQVFFF